jgi:hypothetical protein
MNVQRMYWRPGRWAKSRLVDDVDVADALIEHDFTTLRRPVLWVEAERIDGYTDDRLDVELWEFRHRRWGWKMPVVRNYVVDASVWLQPNGTTAAGFFQVSSFWRRGDAVMHLDRMVRVGERLKAFV